MARLPRMTLALVILCFALSGFAALLYQTAWMRLFAIAFGTSEISVVIVLAGYMAGLAIGAWAAARFVDRLRRPVLVYGLLEGAIAAAALGLPLLVKLSGELYALLAGGQPVPPNAGGLGQTFYYSLASMLALLIPTGLMGATLPLLARYAVTSNRNLGGRISLLYSMNTLGAVGGTLAAAFLLLPALGLQGTVWVGALINALVFAAAVLLARGASAARAAPPAGNGKAEGAKQRPGLRISIPLIALSGVLSFTYEVLWTRMLSHVLGSSTFAFATMLAAFLTGIALGAAGAGPLARKPRPALAAFGWCQLGAALCSALVYWRLESWAPGGGLALLAFVVILPSALFIGATYPLAVRAHAGGAADAGRSSAIIYSWNTLGSIAGALLAGFLIVPALGFAGTVRFAVWGNLGLGLCALAAAFWAEARRRGHSALLAGMVSQPVLVVGELVLAAKRRRAYLAGRDFEAGAAPANGTEPAAASGDGAEVSRFRRWGRRYGSASALAAGLLLAAATGLLFQPGRPDALVTRHIFGGSGEQILREIHYAVGRSSTVYLTENPSRFDLSTNGLPEAQVEFKGAPPLLLSQRWLGLWPSLARPDLESLLVVGLGGGVALEGAPPMIDAIHVVELEEEVVRANAAIGPRRLRDPLAEPRIRLIFNDARNALRLTSRRYDAIVSQPSHPWTAGASHLFTREFFALAKSRLTEDGLLVQWMNADLIDETLLRQLAATLLAEFQNVRIYQPSALVLHFLASDGPLDIEPQLAATGRPLLDAPEHFSHNSLHGPADLVAALLLDEAGVAALADGQEPITDDRNAMALSSRSEADGLDLAALTALAAPGDPLLNPESWLRRSLSDEDLAYVAIRLVRIGQVARLERLLETLERPSSRNLLRAILLSAQGQADEAEQLLGSIAPGEPTYEQALFLRVTASGPGAIPARELASNRISERLRAVLAGWLALDAQNWSTLSILDAQLDETRRSDLWAPQAAQMRAEWRLRTRDPDGRLAREALREINRFLATEGAGPKFALRARLALKLENAPIFVESVAHWVQAVQKRLASLADPAEPLPALEYRWTASAGEQFAKELSLLPPETLGGRANVVLQEVLALQERMAAHAPDQPRQEAPAPEE